MSEYLTHNPKPPETTKSIVDLLRDEEFVADLEELRYTLAAYTDIESCTPEEIALADRRLNDFNAKYFGIYYLERPATITYASHEKATGNLNVTSLTGEFIGIVPETHDTNQIIDKESVSYIEDVSQQQPAILLTKENNHYTFPLDDKILQFDIHAPPLSPDNRTLLGVLRKIEAEISYFVKTKTFQAMAPDDQSAQIGELLAECQQNSVVDIFSRSPSTIMTKDSVFRADGFSVVPLQEGANLNLYLQFTLPDSKDHVVLPPSEIECIIRDIQSDDRQGATDTLHDFFLSEDAQEKINDMENSINYEDDEDEKQSLIKELANEMNALVGESDRFWDSIYDIEGILYQRASNDSVEGTYGQISKARAVGFDFKIIDNKYRLVFSYVVADPVSDEEKLVYILPDKKYTSRIDGIYNPSMIDKFTVSVDIIDFVRVSAEEGRILTSNKSFLDSHHKIQIDMLNQLTLDIEVDLAEYYDIKVGDSISFVSGSYFPTLSNKVNMTCGEIARFAPVCFMELPPDRKDSISGTYRGVTFPEATINPNGQRFETIEDFPLSMGKPMLVVDNPELKIAYFIPLEDIRLLHGPDTNEN